MKDYIEIKGAKMHNLKNVDLKIPKNKLITFAGISGSGKSSMAFDTIYAEGQRRYVESLSTYARQFLGIKDKPEVDFIEGLSPAISIEQKSRSHNPRSTVGTITEIYDYMRILYARVGKPVCYSCGRKIGKQSADEMIDKILEYTEGTKFMILAPIVRNRKGEYKEFFEKIAREGFIRVKVNDEIIMLDEEIDLDKKKKHNIDVIIDRLSIREGIRTRLADSVDTALRYGSGKMIMELKDGSQKFFSEDLHCPYCDISYKDITPQTFSFNSPQGMCEDCNGLGEQQVVAIDKLVPNKELSVNDGAVRFWGELRKKQDRWYYGRVKRLFDFHDMSMDAPFEELPDDFVDKLFYGDDTLGTEGVVNIIQRRYKTTKSSDARAYYENKFMSEKVCKTCNGKRLNREALHVLIDGKNISDLVSIPIRDLYEFLENINLDKRSYEIAKELLKEIKSRVKFLLDVGLYYLSLNRKAPTLSGGESQRIRLASQIGSGLTGVLYVLDEPSIGLHQRDNMNLITSLENLRDLGNTVIIVEHDRDTIERSDRIVEFGPRAGVFGGEIVFEGTPEKLEKDENSLTGKYLRYDKFISPKDEIREIKDEWIEINGCRQNNLNNIDVKIPKEVMTLVTGVSGAGKSSLIFDTLYPALNNKINRSWKNVGDFDEIKGYEEFNKVIEISQDPIGRTPRSNPATYTKAFDGIRELFASLPEAKIRGYDRGRFSFNVKGGRCEACKGTGVQQIKMHFLTDIYIDCEVCNGKRYNKETLEIRYNGKNINDVLNMTVEEALDFFEKIPKIKRKLKTLYDVGLGYIKLGQSATTLSGGEAQRIKLARELSKRSRGDTIYLLDEPTTGLHFDDIKKLLNVLNRLVDRGNTVVIVEHNLDVIKYADWIIDLGPEGGRDGGNIVYQGEFPGILDSEKSYTGKYLREYRNI
ncbi:MAG: excinuclease ABC subunit UvrA [Candidatus Mcinerneyibacterium aminivorans]|uniref:UvrABC system protein A n=1 Tax=Candidatus Mcinerneyibacterium aminivorans TaxID=2703815 RepID=A0A5D0MEU9_9BACT|nr:MAG: excinuclease ABC subunit UvrA [Candidatus Mcinerneyibacterium aminivorans]